MLNIWILVGLRSMYTNMMRSNCHVSHDEIELKDSNL